jgi:hypothetical protein
VPEYRGNHYALYDEHHVQRHSDELGRSRDVVMKTERRFSLRVHHDDLWFEAWVVPDERFVTYEPCDIEWLRWAGDAHIKRFPIEPGVKFNAKRLTGEDAVIYVTSTRLELWTTYVEVTGFAIDAEKLGGFYVR